LKIDHPQRIVFHEITKSAIEEALKHPRSLNLNLVNAQQARRILDRLVGYKLSPFLWYKVAKGLSAGRVQSVALRLIVERENEIRNFKPEEYWTIISELKIENEKLKIIEALLNKIDNKILDKFDIPNKETADKIVAELEKEKYQIANIERSQLKRNPLSPFTTSTLQQEAAKRLHFSSKRTMMIAQKLYENGLITYMRTDSVNLSQEALSAAKKWINENFGSGYAAQAPRQFATKSKLAQEAHEAIRPTDVQVLPEQLDREESDKKLYKLIWQRFVASQMPQAIFDATTITINAGRYELKTTGNILRFDGFLKVWPMKFEEKVLPELTESQSLDLEKIIPGQHFTEPPARYSEATLIKTLEKNGIGRPSTYAPTISVIQVRNYVNKQQGRFYPTEIGELVSKVLTENFPEIVDIEFTARMEDDLDKVAHGKEEWQKLLKSFYEPFAKNLDEKYQSVKKKDVIQSGTEETGEVCEKCGQPMVYRMSKFGKFLACSGFPKCRNIKSLKKPASGAEDSSNETNKLLNQKCPKCSEGNIVERFTRKRHKIFWGCSAYPKCDWASWEKPKLEEVINEK
jgi:DNA topoisomerase-1